MRIAVYRPPGVGKLPVIIREEHALGHLEEVPAILNRGYMFVEFAREDLDPDKPSVVGPAQQAYPEFDWATLAVWAWGAMRVVDYLETRDDVDREKIGIVGHSRGGKMALLAGALDERFALVAANGSGCGGAGCFRHQEGKVETLDLITYFTAGEPEVHAWTIRRGTKAPQAAGKIHSDFERGFIRAEVMKCEDLFELGSEQAVKAAGKLGVEGKDYVVQDGDIMHFRFNV